MTTPQRKIRIRMTNRVVTDSPDVLRQVSEAFKTDDIDIDIDESTLQEACSPLVESATTTAKNTLDLQDQAVKEGLIKVEKPEEAERKTRKWLGEMRAEGAKVTAQVVLREVFARLLDMTKG